MTAQKDFVDGRVVDGRVTIDVFRYGQTLPLHPGVEHPQDEIKAISGKDLTVLE